MRDIEFDFLKGTKSNGTLIPLFIKKIEVINQISEDERYFQILKLFLSEDLFNHNWQFSVEFININNNQILDLNLVQLTGFEIENITNRQMENCNYHIFDYQDGKYDFYCEKINIVKK
ncbi:hypothetical protein [Flavobacterium sp. GP15]|uniref:hypothetical protein n=1 Tax=Flavobacterium sp. GP15 TaxID=2758567 RepID=UPI00165E7570|nr:hypothetical protein [Flavobacterium sp. GP15]